MIILFKSAESTVPFLSRSQPLHQSGSKQVISHLSTNLIVNAEAAIKIHNESVPDACREAPFRALLNNTFSLCARRFSGGNYNCTHHICAVIEIHTKGVIHVRDAPVRDGKVYPASGKHHA